MIEYKAIAAATAILMAGVTMAGVRSLDRPKARWQIVEFDLAPIVSEPAAAVRPLAANGGDLIGLEDGSGFRLPFGRTR